jgi:geranylgeranyl pyrophosphate synthase
MGDADRRQVADLLRTPEPSDGQIQAVVEAVSEMGGLDYSRARAVRLAEQADEELDRLPASPAREVLRASIAYVVDRRR